MRVGEGPDVTADLVQGLTWHTSEARRLDIGRPETVELIFTGPPQRGRRFKLPETKIGTRDTDFTVNAFFKYPRIKR